MAQQQTKFIDLTRSYLPMDPNAFPDSMHVVDMKEEQRVPVMAYDGKNFLPTAYGYKSFFGINKELGADDLAERVDFMLIFQNDALNNFLIALCDSGIWYKAGDTLGAWTQAVVMPHNRDDPLVHFEWSFDTLEDDLYVYREGNEEFHRISSIVAAPGIEVVAITPSFLNMAAQKGLFRAGNRIGMWDSDDSISWASLDDPGDFTPNLETLAGNAKFKLVTGKIVNILSHGDGFIVYATKSIVYARKAESSLFLWSPTLVLSTGIAYREEVIKTVPHTRHFAFTGMGLYQIENGNPEVIIPEITDFFKLNSGPKYLRFLEGRYLYFGLMDPNYRTGFPVLVEGVIPGTTIEYSAENLQELFAETQGENPTLTFQDFMTLLHNGVFMNFDAIPPDGGGEGPIS